MNFHVMPQNGLTDSDGTGNNTDTDDDGDGVDDTTDLFPLDGTEWVDFDLDGTGNNADPDDDGDGFSDDLDIFPDKQQLILSKVVFLILSILMMIMMEHLIHPMPFR